MTRVSGINFAQRHRKCASTLRIATSVVLGRGRKVASNRRIETFVNLVCIQVEKGVAVVATPGGTFGYGVPSRYDQA